MLAETSVGSHSNKLAHVPGLDPLIISMGTLQTSDFTTGTFAVIIGLLAMKRPLNLVMSIASVVVMVLYALPVGQILPALQAGLLGDWYPISFRTMRC